MAREIVSSAPLNLGTSSVGRVGASQCATTVERTLLLVSLLRSIVALAVGEVWRDTPEYIYLRSGFITLRQTPCHLHLYFYLSK